MKSTRIVCAALFLFHFFTASLALGQRAPKWTVEVPPYPFGQHSEITATYIDAAGNSFVVITHYEVSSPLHTQILLISRNGKLLGSTGFFGNPEIIPISISGRRCVFGTGVFVQYGVANADGSLSVAPVQFSSPEEIASITPAPSSNKYIITRAPLGGKISQLRQYSVVKLRPAGN